MESTTDHEVIKNWITKWGGIPAIGAGSEDGNGKGLLRINFAERADNGQPIDWEEFFDIFEADNLIFRYNSEVVKGSEELSFNFGDRVKTPSGKDDETLLPETNKMAEENMYDNFEIDQSY